MSEPAKIPDSDSSGPQVSIHRWPWRTEEFISMGIAFLLTLGIGYLGYNTWRDTMPPVVALTIATLTLLAALGSVYYLYRVKKKRTDTSQVTITVIGTIVRSESRGPLGSSQSDVANAETFSYRRFGSDETFMISDGNKPVRIPLRATADPYVRRAVETAYQRVADEKKSAESVTLFNKMQAGDLPV